MDTLPNHQRRSLLVSQLIFVGVPLLLLIHCKCARCLRCLTLYLSTATGVRRRPCEWGFRDMKPLRVAETGPTAPAHERPRRPKKPRQELCQPPWKP